MPALLTRMIEALDGGDSGGDGRRTGDVELNCPGRAGRGRQLLRSGLVDVGDPHEGARAHQFLDGRFADTAGAAGYEGVAPVNPKCVWMPMNCIIAHGNFSPLLSICVLRVFKNNRRGIGGGDRAGNHTVDDGGKGSHIRAGRELPCAQRDSFNLAVHGNLGLQRRGCAM